MFALCLIQQKPLTTPPKPYQFVHYARMPKDIHVNFQGREILTDTVVKFTERFSCALRPACAATVTRDAAVPTVRCSTSGCV